MVVWCYILSSILGGVVALYCLLELHYFLRMSLCAILARFFKKKSHILDTTTITGICLTTDVDQLLTHMNNARYLRELDFARVDFYERTNLYRTIVSNGGGVVQGAATIRYRRFIRTFTVYKITSKIIYWDTQSIFMEHRFICPKDNFIHCIAICRQRITDCSADDIMSKLLNHTGATTQTSFSNNDISMVENGNAFKLKPEMPLELLKWMEYNEISSKNLRDGC